MLQTHYSQTAKFYFDHRNDKTKLVWSCDLKETKDTLEHILECLKCTT